VAKTVPPRYDLGVAEREPRFPKDPVIEAYKKDVDVTLLDENLKRTPTERLERMISMLRLTEELRRAMRSR
jgi:hypothetical protein